MLKTPISRSFTASRMSGDGNSVFPDEIILKNGFVIFRKGKVIGSKEVKIPFSSIGSVSVDKHLLFVDITVESSGGVTFTARGFTRSDADEIVGLLNGTGYYEIMSFDDYDI